jgi:hypothetical protein
MPEVLSTRPRLRAGLNAVADAETRLQSRSRGWTGQGGVCSSTIHVNGWIAPLGVRCSWRVVAGVANVWPSAAASVSGSYRSHGEG